jgi:hypothetical protein
MKNITGNIKEDEQAAFDLVLERVGLVPDDAKGVGYLNRLMKVCSVAKLSITLDYGIGEFGSFTVSNVPESIIAPPAVEEPVEEVKEYVAPESMNLTDADTDPDEQVQEEDNSDPFED